MTSVKQADTNCHASFRWHPAGQKEWVLDCRVKPDNDKTREFAKIQILERRVLPK